ncbi:MAG: hypothetical protein CVT94_08805 [Bacteroidetes bacterium HGW-Bacteroidetes-11]|nr:MAG: hypothetical protein CVT94_08805 [Bacteroidetes bacterium HGW-Bacteroidetes-11]
MRLATQGVAHGFTYTATSWRSADLFTTAGWNIWLYYAALSGRWFDFMRIATQGVAHGFTYTATSWR